MAYFKFPKILLIALAVVTQQAALLAQTPPSPPPPDDSAPTNRKDAATRAQTTPPPPDNSAPTQREGAATRSPCLRVKNRLTALVPLVQKTASNGQGANSKVVLGKTAAERPSFWFYVPYTFTPAHPVEFLLQDEAGKDLYKATLEASQTAPGVVGFELPSTAPALEVGKRYHWFFSVYCNPEEPVFVAGWVERVALNPSLLPQLEQATQREKFALYQKADLWHEAIATLAQLRRQNPEDTKLKAEWSNLLQSIDLNAIAPEPITAMLTQTIGPIAPSN
jgi:hypothetical protein